MADSPISTAIQKVEAALNRKPEWASQPDAPARAVLTGGLAMQIHHPEGHTVNTDMPTALGGGQTSVSPGWLMRAGLAACTASVIAMRAERLGIRLTRLEVTAQSRSDMRGMLGLDPSIAAGPPAIDMQVEIEAEGVDQDALAELVAWADEHSPVGSTVRRPIDIRLSVNGSRRAVH